MIGKLKGTLADVEGSEGLVETASGVFYKLFLTPTILSSHSVGDEVEMYTYLQVREDSLTLFGFESRQKYRLFDMLLKVDKVGPKLAFTVISYATPQAITSAVNAQDVIFFSQIPGIGKKTAQKILLELSLRVGAEYEFKRVKLTEDDATVVEALVSLGFARNEGLKILSKLDKKLSVEDRIKEAIQKLSRPV